MRRPQASNRSFIRSYLRLLLAALSLFIPLAQANDAALAWLALQSQSDGRYQHVGNIATAPQATAETLRTLKALSAPGATDPLPLAFLANTGPDATEYLARAVIATAEADVIDTTALAALEARRNPDGGFGGAAGYASDLLDTALALEALAAARSSNYTAVSGAIGYLLAHRALDDGYALDPRAGSSIHATAAALAALHRYRLDFDVAAPIAGAVGYLLATQTASGGWGDDFETALALLALVPATTDAAPLAFGLQALESAQLTDGSWGQDVYRTALAARALAVAKGAPGSTPPTTGGVTGQVVDAQSGLPLAGVAVSLGGGPATVTAATGRFALDGLVPGAQALSYGLPGYAAADQAFTLGAGQRLDLGTVRLAVLPTTGIVTGTVTDAATGQPLVGAQIALTGGTSLAAITDAIGGYRLVAPPGPIALEASAPGHLAASGTATLLAGQTLRFSPALPADGGPAPTTATVTGLALDAQTGQPLVGATLATADGAFQTGTGSDGRFQLVGLAPGALDLTLAAAGHQDLRIALTAPAGVSDLGSLALQVLIAPTTVALIGTVTDHATGLPLVGATVGLAGGPSTRTGGDGGYRLDNLAPTTFTVAIEAIGYISQRGDIALAQPGTVRLDAALDRAAHADLDIDALALGRPDYPANSRIEAQVHLVNAAATERPVRLYVTILDASGQTVEQFPARRVPLGGDPASALVVVPPDGGADTTVEWNNGGRAPGHYDLIVQAYDGAGGQLLAERGVPVTLSETRAIGGSTQFDPPVAQLAAQTPVSLTARIANRGNLDLPGGTATAKITVKNPGYAAANAVVELQVLAQNNGLSYPRSIDRDASGNFYVVNYTGTNANRLMRVDPAGTVTEVAAGFANPVDVDVAPNGDIYVLNNYASYERLTADGGRQKTTTYPPSPSLSHQAIEVLANGKVLLAAGINGVWDVTAAAKTKLPIVGLGNATEIQADAHGTVYLGDYTQGAIFRLRADYGLDLIQANLPYLETFAIGADGTLAAVYGSGANKLALILPDGTRQEIPYSQSSYSRGIAWDADHTLVTATDSNSAVFKLYLPTAASATAAGQVVHTQSVPLSPLGLADVAQALDFGHWTPTASGDFQVEVTVDGHPEYGAVYDTLHIGPNAHGSFAVAAPNVRPGDASSQATLTVFGADSTSVTRIDPAGTSLAASSNAQGRGIAADTQGNIYATHTSTASSIVRITPKGQVSTFVSGYTFGYGLAIDAQNNLYAFGNSAASYPSNQTILKIAPDTTATELATLGAPIGGLSIGPDGYLYAMEYTGTSSAALSRIHPDGRVEQLSKPTIPLARGLTIDANGYFYIQSQSSKSVLDEDGVNRSYNKIFRVSPDGKRYSEYFTHASFEFEGVNITADCSNNLMFAPIADYPFKTGGEEGLLMQLVGDTGEQRQVLYGPSVNSALSDMDVLFYDRFGKRLLIWTDLNQGKIFSFPVICGGIDADVHLVTRADVAVSNLTPAPARSTDRGDGTVEHIWTLKDVDNRGTALAMNLFLPGMAEGERRPVAQDAWVEYHNSFAPGQTVRTPLAIPEVFATTAMSLAPSLDASRYGPQSPVTIQVGVKNDGVLPFDGELRLSIVDGLGFPVQDLPPIAVSGQPGPSTLGYPALWTTGLFQTGDYRLAATLLDPVGRTVATGSAPFAIVADPGGAPTLDARLSPDKLLYAAWDRVNLDGLVANTAANAALASTVMAVTVTDPGGATVYTGLATIGELAPGGLAPAGFAFALADAPAGAYTVAVRVTDALLGTPLAEFQKTFGVVRDPLQGLAGTVTATPMSVPVGTALACADSVANRAASALPGLSLNSVLVDLDHGAVMSQDTRVVDLAALGTDTRTRTLDTTVLTPGTYGCVLRATLDGVDRDLASAAFTLTPPPVTLSGSVFHDLDRDLIRAATEPAATARLWVAAAANGTVAAAAKVQADGGYALTVPGFARYTLVLATRADATAPGLPFGWTPVGESRNGVPDSAPDGLWTVDLDRHDLSGLDFALVGLPPLANNDHAATVQGVAVTLPLLANDHPGVGAARLDSAGIDLDPATPAPETTVAIPGEGRFQADPATGTVTFTPLPGFSGVSALAYTARDDLGRVTNTASLEVRVAGPAYADGGDPAAPRANPDTATTPVGLPVQIAATLNDVPGPGARLDPATLDLNPSTPAIEADRTTPEGAWHSPGDGSVVFVPAAAISGPARLDYALADTTGRTATATLTVQVIGGAQPLAQDDRAETRPTVPVTLPILANDAASVGHDLVAASLDLDPATPAVESALDTAEGRWTAQPDGLLTFTPAADHQNSGKPFSGDTPPLAYAIADETGLTATATVAVRVDPTLPPAAMDDAADAPFNTPVTLAPAANDRAEPGAVLDPATLDLDSATEAVDTHLATADGDWQGHPDGTLTYTPAPDSHGSAAPLTYLIRDSLGHAAAAQVRVTVAPPTSVVLGGTVFHDLDHSGLRDAGEPATAAGGLHVTAVTATGAAFATAPVAADGGYALAVPPLAAYTLVLSPTANGTAFALPTGWSATVPADGHHAVQVGVRPVTGLDFGIDGAPSVANGDRAATAHNTPVTLAPLANDIPGPGTTRLDPATLDLDPATPAVESRITQAGQGTYAAGADGTVTFTPDPAFSGVSAAAYRVRDDLAQPTNAATLAVAVGPDARDDALTTPAATPATGGLATNDLAPADAVYGLDTPPAHGTAAVTAQGGYIYTPAPGYGGPDAFAYRVCLPAPDGSLCDSARVVVTVTPPTPVVDLDAHLRLGTRPRLLVLVDPLDEDCADDEDKSDDKDGDKSGDKAGDDKDGDKSSGDKDGDRSVCHAQQAGRAWLDWVLQSGGWTYDRVDRADAYTQALHAGAHRLHALLSGRVKLDEPVQKELREAVNHGLGLLVGGGHDQRNNVLDDALGIHYQGRAQNAVSVDIPATPGYAGLAAALPAAAAVNRVTPQGATVLGRLLDAKGKPTDPAATHQTYGRGEAAYLALDLPALGAVAEPLGVGGYGQLLLDLLDDLAPVANDAPFAVVPLRINLRNLGPAVQGQIDLALGGGAALYDPGTATVLADGTLRWPYALAADGALDREAWARLPASGTAMATARIRADGAAQDPYATLDVTLPVVAAPGLDAALTRLKTLARTDRRYQGAQQAAQRAANALAQADLGTARAELVKAADALIKLGTADANDLRQAIDEALRRVRPPG